MCFVGMRGIAHTKLKNKLSPSCLPVLCLSFSWQADWASTRSTARTPGATTLSSRAWKTLRRSQPCCPRERRFRRCAWCLPRVSVCLPQTRTALESQRRRRPALKKTQRCKWCPVCGGRAGLGRARTTKPSCLTWTSPRRRPAASARGSPITRGTSFGVGGRLEAGGYWTGGGGARGQGGGMMGLARKFSCILILG